MLRNERLQQGFNFGASPLVFERIWFYTTVIYTPHCTLQCSCYMNLCSTRTYISANLLCFVVFFSFNRKRTFIFQRLCRFLATASLKEEKRWRFIPFACFILFWRGWSFPTRSAAELLSGAAIMNPVWRKLTRESIMILLL